MRRIIFALPLLLTACGTAPQPAPGADPGPVPSGMARKTLPLTGFERVDLAGSDNVQVQMGSGFAVMMQGPAAALDVMDVSVSNATLKVSRKADAPMLTKGVTVFVTLPALTGATLSGSGDMDVIAPKGRIFGGTLSGSGMFRVTDAALDTASLDLAGSGKASLSGTANVASVQVRGSGDADASKLAAKRVEVMLTGSGKVDMTASESANITMLGSGDVTVTGTKNCTVASKGSGKVNCGA